LPGGLASPRDLLHSRVIGSVIENVAPPSELFVARIFPP
jgi:hypothetical protein